MYKLYTAPAVEPILKAEAKLYLKQDSTADDDLIDSLIIAARIEVENILGYKLINQTWDYWQKDFTDPIQIDMLPLSSITHVKYLDINRVEQTVANTDYYVYTNTEPGLIEPVSNWPIAGDWYNAVNVRFVTGFGAAATNIPEFELIERAMLMIIADAYEFRENSQPSHSAIKSIPNSAKNILMSLRSFR
jgi:uncharacterized phiE125 gp8 family phage protein